MHWARSHDASVYQHWTQPMGASGVRHGLSAGVQNTMMKFQADGCPAWDFSGNNLRFGETDGSSYNNGGLRHTHQAGGYVTIDPSSPIFLRGDTVFIPSVLTSFDGHALDEKTPLKRAEEAISREGKRLLEQLGVKGVEGLKMNIGVEQEFFFVPRSGYVNRQDLMLTGRTLMGRDAPRGQEMDDHYMATLSSVTPPLFAMQEIQRQCMMMGIPLRTRHREVAPGQYEFAPLYGTATTQADQNIVTMQIIEEVAASYGLAALLQEKPFNGINGSGKHNNWSVAFTGLESEVNLLNPKQVSKATGNAEIFPVIMAALLKAVAENGDLLRMACATPGNDFRLGACEAPPAILSVYFGEDLTQYLESFAGGNLEPYAPSTGFLDTGCSDLPLTPRPAEDRNRTSPFPYGGSRFEFRAVGSAQNVAIVNTVLGTIAASAFKSFADAIEGGTPPRDVAAAALREHMDTHVFNGNSYDEQCQQQLTERGCWRIDSCVDAHMRMTEPKNISLFESMGVCVSCNSACFA
eukprot:INCI17514.12.p1 GENE.INCI17514.12~~INCI17514.12.p1  ORF type:complete len:521 (-),score=87.37 INCI17514.12:899-2461(-)